MREIKFRAWDRPAKLMRYDVTPAPQNGMHYGELWADIGSTGEHGNLENEFDLMQFTGLKDKNGIEIYEGDIVRVGQFINEEEDETGWFDESIHEVQWCGPSYPAFDLIPHTDCECNGLQFYADIREDQCAIEIIGNIYEHPNLLNPRTEK